jgi:adenylate kinase
MDQVRPRTEGADAAPWRGATAGNGGRTPLNLALLGAPGAGKGTQAARFARDRGIPQISTGDILREAVASRNELGLRAKAVMDSGKLVSDEVIIAIVKERLDRSDAAGGFVLDGFPRTVAQAIALDGIVEGRAPLIVVDIDVPETELVKRLAARLVCARCGANADTTPGDAVPVWCARCSGPLVQRSDDSEGVVRERLDVYRRKTMPLLDYYRPRPTFCAINGAQPPDRVAEELAAAVDDMTDGATAGGSRR